MTHWIIRSRGNGLVVTTHRLRAIVERQLHLLSARGDACMPLSIEMKPMERDMA